MAAEETEVVCRLATREDPLEQAIAVVIDRARAVRGGGALLEQLWGPEQEPRGYEKRALDEIALGHLWVAQSGDEIIAVALFAERCVRAIWVAPHYRRQRVASRLLNTLLATASPPRDAWALPGDRATKSLYESVGWKARLLTMRGE